MDGTDIVTIMRDMETSISTRTHTDERSQVQLPPISRKKEVLQSRSRHRCLVTYRSTGFFWMAKVKVQIMGHPYMM